MAGAQDAEALSMSWAIIADAIDEVAPMKLPLLGNGRAAEPIDSLSCCHTTRTGTEIRPSGT